MCVLSIILFAKYLIPPCMGTSKVLLVSMDGFRWDYTQKWPTPNFEMMAENGTRAKYINNTFITKTFPSHYSVATGLFEESHGIVGNTMFDPLFNESFKLGRNDTFDPKWWDGGEPIWVTARKGGLKSATFFWPGSEAKVRGYRPNEYRSYNKSIPFDTRIDQVITWLKSDIDLVVMYFHEPDATGHMYGPDAEETRKKVIAMDAVLGDLISKLTENLLWGTVNLLVTSDHGMTEVDFQKKVIDISTAVSLDNDIQHTVDSGPVMHIIPRDGGEGEVYRKLSSLTNMRIYYKKDIPEYWHYKDNRRIMPILMVADEGWSIVKNASAASTITNRGNHGYDNTLMSMKPIFYARGPNIRKNFTTEPFLSVDIYPLICSLLNITPAPNNGSISRTQHFLVGRDSPRTVPQAYNSAVMEKTIPQRSNYIFLMFLLCLCIS